MKHQREPIKHTCPEIDKYIKAIKQSIVSIREIKTMEEDELKSCAESMSNTLEDCIYWFEVIRESNDTLRTWAIKEAEMVDNLESLSEVLP